MAQWLGTSAASWARPKATHLPRHRRRWQAFMGVSGKLLENRIKGEDLARKLVGEFGKGKGNMGSLVRQSYQKAKFDIPSDVEASLASYDDKLKLLKGVTQAQLCTWTLDSSASEVLSLEQIELDIKKLKITLGQAIETLRTIATETRNKCRQSAWKMPSNSTRPLTCGKARFQRCC